MPQDQSPPQGGAQDGEIIHDKMNHPQLARMRSRRENKNQTKAQRIKTWFHDPKHGKYLGRTCSEWGRVCILYCIFFAFLFGITTIFMLVFLVFLVDSHLPVRYGEVSLVGVNPGLSLIAPKTENFEKDDMSLISFQKDSNTWKKYVDSIRKQLTKYKTAQSDSKHLVDCSDDVGYKSKKEDEFFASCKYDVTRGFDKCACGADCESNNFGYDSMEPCFAIGVSKVIGWKPEPTMKLETRGECESKTVKFECKGHTPADNEHFSHVEFFPKEGIPLCYYPFYNSPTYQQPFTMGRLIKAKKGLHIHLTCYANCSNCHVDEKNGLGVGFVDFYMTDDTLPEKDKK